MVFLGFLGFCTDKPPNYPQATSACRQFINSKFAIGSRYGAVYNLITCLVKNRYGSIIYWFLTHRINNSTGNAGARIGNYVSCFYHSEWQKEQQQKLYF